MKINYLSFLTIILTGTIFLYGSARSSTITINTTAIIEDDSQDGLCTLSEAVLAANTNQASGTVNGECVAGEFHPVTDVIQFDNAILPAFFYTFNEYTFTESVHIDGPSKELVTFTGLALNRVFTFFNISSDTTFRVTDITFRDNNILANEIYGGAILATLFNGGSLIIKRADFINNQAERGGGALAFWNSANNDNNIIIEDSYFQGNMTTNIDKNEVGGGAIFIGGRQNITIKNSTFADNSVQNFFGIQPLSDSAGGAILVRSTGVDFTSEILIENSTFTNNSAYGVGGAIAMGGPGYPNERSIVTIKHSTFVGNTADFNENQPPSDRGGGGIYSSSNTAVNLFNSIVAHNNDNSSNPAPELAGVFLSAGYNLIGNNTNIDIAFPLGLPNSNDDWVGGGPAVIYPELEALADNGGPTLTMMPSAKSLVIDNGKCNVLNIDQRHYQNPDTNLRTFDDPDLANALSGCDIGAVERYSTAENPAPMAIDDTYQVLEDEVVIIDAGQGLLSNDLDENHLWVTNAGSIPVLDDANVEVGNLELLADGTLKYEPILADYYGSFSADYHITDRLNRDSATLQLDILPVNDHPELIAHADTINGIPNEYTTVPWAAFFSAGPANEANQSLIFQVDISAVPAGFFNIIPSIDPVNGDMSFEISTNATGAVAVEITLMDDGGTANGGIDTTGPLTAVIAVSDVIFADDFESNP